MRTGRPAARIELSDEERTELLHRSRQRKGAAESRILRGNHFGMRAW